MATKANSSNHVRLRVLIGPTFVPLYVSEREYDKLMDGLKTRKSEWMDIALPGGNVAQIKLSDVSFVERVSETGGIAIDGTIPICIATF